jgi:hypothetical protein
MGLVGENLLSAAAILVFPSVILLLPPHLELIRGGSPLKRKSGVLGPRRPMGDYLWYL